MTEQSMWGGRFREATNELVRQYTESLDTDRHFALEEVDCSRAHVRMLIRCGILEPQEGERLLAGLEQIRSEMSEETFPWRSELEDVHMNVEHRLTELVGEVGQKLHTGRSRNDQVAAGFRLYAERCLAAWSGALLEVVHSLTAQAKAHQRTIMPGYTHLQPAQPVTLAHHLLAYAQMLRRDFERIEQCRERVRVCPLGAAALGGTTHPVQPEFTARELGFRRAFENSMDAVSDRDFVAEGLFQASMVMTHLSRLCEELILWANPGFGFVRLPDAFATGSSIMPQKKNPDVAELVRGRTGSVFGSLQSLLTLLKGLPLAYNRDLQEDKRGFIQAHATVRSSLLLAARMMHELEFDAARMREATEQGYLNATELADYLATRGVPFRQAHHITGRAVAYAENDGRQLQELTLEELQGFSPEIEADVYEWLELETAVARRNSPGGTGFEAVGSQLRELEQWLEDKRNGGSV